MTLIAASTDNLVQGRVFSMFHTIRSSLLALSMMVAGFLIPVLGPQLLGIIGGSVILLFSILYAVLIRRNNRTEQNGSEYRAA
ncbi:hypothetical protein [Effusibacillus consociatus]|uniref:MFS transporter n=1 Tax=Effusibacillus consociatus TaxID=1117041 RepID=A0ABV9PZ34_9BACL